MRTSRNAAAIWRERLSKYSAVITVSLGVFTLNPSVIDFQDFANHISTSGTDRWLAHKVAQPGEITLASAVGGSGASKLDLRTTSSIDPAIEVKTTPKLQVEAQVINRSLKGGRVVQEAAVKPPVHFTAGTIVSSQNLFIGKETDRRIELAFVKPKGQEEALRIASAFHTIEKKPDHIETLPTMVASLVKESESSVMAYAAEPELERSPFALVLNKEPEVAALPILGKKDHDWAAKPLPKHVFSKKQQKCLAEGIYFEARGESVRGQAAVSQVILNRVRNPAYPKTICGVVYQNRQKRNRCQFSFACDNIRDKIRDQKSWSIAKHVAAETTAGRIWFKQVGSATHYHASYVKPKWARAMDKVGRIGLHLFYRTKNGGLG